MQNWTLITGASEGLGAEFARIAAREGRNLILTARSEDKLTALADELRSDTVQVEVIPADLAELSEAERLWQAASENRRIDVLVNNAGLGSHGDFAEGQTWTRELTSINVNITALSVLMKQAVAHMQGQGGGRIMNVASVAGFMPGPNMAVYHASKAYVLALSEAVAEELRGSGVTVTAVCPGATATAFFDAADMHGIGLLKLRAPMSARAVAETGWAATMRGRRIAVTGLMNKLFAVSPRFAPRWLTTFITGKIMGKGR
ncbi:SDR family NAD(P)-dependent oxidoreductase [Roseovarius aestuarii]|uniref:3-oxoacyl-[acyl-carrier-protein] reductase FabG n=1 Tax=Roseovarius aestuarii TaxID=475083 RepID=A0A1X7BNV8_9RHOB|nr:SDR family oxidoreductase [Roseovarius aestuarii]SMC10959.1 3-oxoacyl-[acyl-carrier-protein] reductase FabG [Roseovarius aestuarii]